MLAPQDLGGLFDTKEELAANFAAQWLMIPLTRAMDTLVINVSSSPSIVKQALKKVYKTRSDFVEWIKV